MWRRERKTGLIKRGNIYIADLEPIVGSEQSGIRPVLIIQNDIGNKFGPTVLVAPITSKNHKKLPTHILVNNVNNLIYFYLIPLFVPRVSLNRVLNY